MKIAKVNLTITGTIEFEDQTLEVHGKMNADVPLFPTSEVETTPEPATAKQTAYLHFNNIEYDRNITKEDAHKLISENEERKKRLFTPDPTPLEQVEKDAPVKRKVGRPRKETRPSLPVDDMPF